MSAPRPAYNPSSRTDAEIQEVLDIAGDDNGQRHMLFAYLILREPLWPFSLMVRYEKVPLTLPVARAIADGWLES